MNRATDAIWLCAPPLDARARTLAARLGLAEVSRNSRLVVCSPKERNSDVSQTKAALEKAGYVKYFENAYLSQALGGQARQQLIQCYFDTISSRYGELAQSGVNVACYNHLFSEARRVAPPLKTCMDFGCGPGTILDSDVPAATVNLVGWDFSPRMRHVARSRGLTVMQDGDFHAKLLGADLVLSAYVFHYDTVTPTLLKRVSAHLNLGGLFVANFHKGLGLESFLETLKHVPALALAAPVGSSPFGPVMLLKRVAR